MNTKNLLLIFTRNPKIGKVKSRLAQSIGNQKALAVYHELLSHTQKITNNILAEKWVFYSEEIPEDDIWTSHRYHKKIQIGETLGDKMSNAFKEGFDNGYEKIIIIGSDIIDLNKEHISDAFEKFSSFDSVIGPAEDGGYYLLGMQTFIPEVFKHKHWGSDSVFKETLIDLEKNNSIYFLETLNDIDVISDIKPDSYLAKYI